MNCKSFWICGPWLGVIGGGALAEKCQAQSPHFKQLLHRASERRNPAFLDISRWFAHLVLTSTKKNCQYTIQIEEKKPDPRGVQQQSLKTVWHHEYSDTGASRWTLGMVVSDMQPKGIDSKRKEIQWRLYDFLIARKAVSVRVWPIPRCPRINSPSKCPAPRIRIVRGLYRMACDKSDNGTQLLWAHISNDRCRCLPGDCRRGALIRVC